MLWISRLGCPTITVKDAATLRSQHEPRQRLRIRMLTADCGMQIPRPSSPPPAAQLLPCVDLRHTDVTHQLSAHLTGLTGLTDVTFIPLFSSHRSPSAAPAPAPAPAPPPLTAGGRRCSRPRRPQPSCRPGRAGRVGAAPGCSWPRAALGSRNRRAPRPDPARRSPGSRAGRSGQRSTHSGGRRRRRYRRGAALRRRSWVPRWAAGGSRCSQRRTPPPDCPSLLGRTAGRPAPESCRSG